MINAQKKILDNMLGQFNLLPLLSGWEYKTHYVIRSNVIRGAPPIMDRINEKGWLLLAQVSSSDAYGTLNVIWQGADLNSTEVSFNAQMAMDAGATVAGSGAHVLKYFRPDPTVTSGFFYSMLQEGGVYGSAWPYNPTILLGVSLLPESTQQSAMVAVMTQNIAITDSEAFIKSLHKVQDPPDASNIKLLLTEIRDLLKR